MNGKVGAGVGIIVLKDGKILLGKRSDDRSKSRLHGEGTWSLPGGKLHFHETFEEAARRELSEETGMQGMEFEVISVSNDMVPDAQFVSVGMLCENFEGEPRVMEPEEITEWRWFGLDELPSPIFISSEKLIKNWLAKKFYSDGHADC